MKMKTYRFPCGCEFPIIEERGEGELPLLDFDIESVRRDCPATFKLLSSGRTKGVFQLESGIGRRWTKAMKPENEEHLGALGSLLRPGALFAVDAEGISMTEHYCRRKNGQEDIPPYHPVVDEVLKDNYNVMAYQEDAMALSMKVAGLTELQADQLRAAIGKKLANEMAKCKAMFIEGVEKTKVITKEQGEELFGWIEKSQKYLFNRCFSLYTIPKRARNGWVACDKYYTIGEMYKIRNSLEYAKKSGHEVLRRKWMRIGHYGKGYSVGEDGRIRNNIIRDIQPSGERPVFRLTLENDSYVDVTLNHKFPTKFGELTLGTFMDDFSQIEILYCCEYEKCKNSYSMSNVTREEIKARNKSKKGLAVNKAFGENNFFYTNGSYTEFQKNDKIIPRICVDCGKDNGRLELHHIDGDRCNSKFENLARLCPSCHKKREYKAGRVRWGEKGYPSKWVKIKSISYKGLEETYDVTMDGPNHTFVTDQNIVTCNSHAMSYGITGYDTAYIKTHFPVAFYAGWLANALHKSKPLDEISELINDAKLFDVSVHPPDLRMMSNHFQTDGKSIRFGIGDIKGIGDAQLKKLSAELEETKKVFGKNVEDLSWTEFIIYFANNLSSSVISKLIEVGALGWFGMSRLLMKAEYDVWNSLSPKEIEWVQNTRPAGNLRTILKTLAKPKKEGGGCSNKNRVAAVLSQLHLLENPPSPLVDSPTLVAYNEEQLLGISITCNVIDSCDISAVNCSCKEFIAGREGYLMLGVEVKNVHECKTKKGKSPGSKMGRLVITDGTCSLDAIAFPDLWKNHSDLFTVGNTVIVQAEHGKDQNEVVIKKVWQASMHA